MNQFAFLQQEFPEIAEDAAKAEGLVHADPRTACFYARRTVELSVNWAFKHDPGLSLPYQENISSLIHEPTFKQTAGEAVFQKAKLVIRLGNRAVHSSRPIPVEDAVVAVAELFHVCYWLARTYSRQQQPPADLAFDKTALPTSAPVPSKTTEQLKSLQEELKRRDDSLKDLLTDKESMSEELKHLRKEIAKAKKENKDQPDTHNYNEAQTRDYFIDLLLKEAGWPLDQKRDREFEVQGMPNNQGKGFVDYVLWGDDGKPLGLVEAKRTKRDARVGQQQAKLYADCLEKEYGQRPVIFCSNGYDHWLWDDSMYPPRAVQGFYKKDELELMIQRRTTRRVLATADINKETVERYYQHRAIRRISESFEKKNERKALLVMATGSGKTRTVIALCEMLMQCNWVKRVLFLADRVALVNQSVNAFKRHLPQATTVNLVKEKNIEGRIYVSTYPTMMGLIDDTKDGQKLFGVGHFDLVVIDEAHRSIFLKYKAIFEYFDSLLVGLTATPRAEIARSTFRIFDLEEEDGKGVPTDSYDLEQAVKDGFLVPPKAISVPLRIPREGLKYDQLSDEEKEQWDELEWDDDGSVPDQVDANAVNKWLFNEDTVDKMLKHLMTQGLKVAGNDRLGKTIIFAKNENHAAFITERFDLNYPNLKGHFARQVTYKTEYTQSLIDDFSKKDAAPHIAVSVDMLDTGIDVPEILNLVFFKIVRSKPKFLQMIGRGTRLCPDLFAPGKDKEFFYVFDFCQNFEFFNENPEAGEGNVSESLSKRLFKARLEMVGILDKVTLTDEESIGVKEEQAPFGESEEPQNLAELRESLAETLHKETDAMNTDNFVVRAKRRTVEKYSKREAWAVLGGDELTELAQEVAGLPSELPAEGEEAKRFDLLLFNLQLALLRSEPAFERLQKQVMEIAGLLEEKSSIPMVNVQMPLIQDVQTESWWQDVSVTMLETLRRRMRDLVKFIEKKNRKPVYTDFLDDLGIGVEVELPGFSHGVDKEKFRDKMRAFLLSHQDSVSIQKLRYNRPLTKEDLQELETVLLTSGSGSAEELHEAAQEAQGLGLFVRSLVGLDRTAAVEAFAGFLSHKNYSSEQIEFVDQIIDHLTEHGVMAPELLYESPFTDNNPQGPESLFQDAELEVLFGVLEMTRNSALVA